MNEREWRPPRLLKPFLRLAPWGFPRQILMILNEGDKTLPEIAAGFTRFMHYFGYFGREGNVAGFTYGRLIAALQEDIEKLIREGVVVQSGEVYRLTPEGQLRAQKMQREFQTLGRWIEHFQHPQTVALTSLGVHIVLAVLKLVTGAVSGSIGLITDGIDTAMDGLSSVLVFVGLRLKKEQIVNVVLVLLMLGVGVGAGYEAVRRIFIPKPVETAPMIFAAAILSGVVCLLLSFYQRHVAARSAQQALIAQAVDSRNHAIVAAGVVIGLVATHLHFSLLDTLVGLAVAALILKSGVELAFETVRSLRGEEVDFSRYELSFVDEYRHFQEQQLAGWLLHIIAEDEPLSQPTLLGRCREQLNAQQVPILRELGWGKEGELEQQVIRALNSLIKQGLVSPGEALRITQEGRAKLGIGPHALNQ